MQQGGLSLLTPRLKLCIECEAHLGIALLVCLSFSIETGNWLLWDFFFICDVESGRLFGGWLFAPICFGPSTTCTQWDTFSTLV